MLGAAQITVGALIAAHEGESDLPVVGGPFGYRRHLLENGQPDESVILIRMIGVAYMRFNPNPIKPQKLIH